MLYRVEKDVVLSRVNARFKINETTTEIKIRIKDDSRLEAVEVFRLQLAIAKRFSNIGVVQGAHSDVLARIISDDSKLAQSF